jgi:predicted metal-dependent peptidase
MFHKALTPAQRLDKAVIDIMAKPELVALSGVMMIGKREIREGIPTACTNGRDEFYGREFVDGLNDAELRFTVLHEVYHKLYKHLTTWRWMFDENPKLANVSADFVVNIQILDELGRGGWVKMPEGGCYDDKYRGWDAAQVFRDLQKRFPPQEGGGGGQGQPGQSGSGMPGGIPEGFDEHDWDGAQEMTEAEKQDLAREIDEALRAGVLAAGKTGSGGDRSFEELLAPQVDWREVLREFIQTTCAGKDYSTWKKPNRRYMGAGYYMPSGISEQIGEIVVAPDMSGSTFTPSMMRTIMGELKGIVESVKPEGVRILYWDTEVCADEYYGGNELDGLMTSTKPEGGGGTRVSCVSDYIRDKQIKAQCVIVLTDGWLGGDWGNWHHETLWVIAGNDRTTSPVGKTVHVREQDM